MQKIFCLGEDEIQVVDTDGAPSGRKDFLVWNPPLIDNANKNLGRRGSISEATLLMRFLMQQGARVLLFCKVCATESFPYSALMRACRYGKFVSW